MNTKTLAILAVVVALLAILLFLAWSSQRTLERGLPPIETAANRPIGFTQASNWASENGGTVVGVMGTGSMRPAIPAAAKGQDPRTTIVAFVVTRADVKFSDVKTGDVCIYKAEWLDGGAVMHSVASIDSGGLIMSGTANARSEAHWRVTKETLIGVVAKIFTWKQE